MATFHLSDKEYADIYKSVFGDERKKKKDNDMLSLIQTAPPKQEKQGIIGDFVDSVQRGMYQGFGDLSRSVGVLTGSEGFNKFADWAAEQADAQFETMSPEMKEALGQSALDGEGKGLLNARWWAGNIGAVIGANLDALATMGGSAALSAGIKQGGKYLAKKMTKETAEAIGETAIKQAAKRGVLPKYYNVIGYSAVMSAMGAGNRANATLSEYLELDDNEVVNHNAFRQNYHDLKNSEEGQGLDHNTLFDMAKEKTALQLAKDSAFDPTAMLTDLGVNALGGIGGGFGGALAPAKTLKGGFVKGALIEGATEGLQGYTEQQAINRAAIENYDPDRDINEGVTDNVINSVVLGAGFGAPMGSVDVAGNRMAVGRQKKEILKVISTGDEEIDAGLRNYVDMVNQNATDLAELVSISRVNALNAIGQKEARAKQIMMLEETATTENEAVAPDSLNAAAERFARNHAPVNEQSVNVVQLSQQFAAQRQDPNNSHFTDEQLKAKLFDEAMGNTKPQQPVQAETNNAPIVTPQEESAATQEITTDDTNEIERVWKGKQNGQPFLSAKEAEMSKTFKDALSGELNPVVINKNGVFLVEMDDVNQFANDSELDAYSDSDIDSYYDSYNGGYDDSPRFSRSAPAYKFKKADVKVADLENRSFGAGRLFFRDGEPLGNILEKSNLLELYPELSGITVKKGSSGIRFNDVTNEITVEPFVSIGAFESVTGNILKEQIDKLGKRSGSIEQAEFAERQKKKAINKITDDEYLFLAERYKNGDRSVEPSLREMVEQKAKLWAKKSQIVDKNGSPAIVYHGTAAEKINEFDYDRIGQQGTADGQGFYFTDSQDFAERYRQDRGSLIRAYLNVPNTLNGEKITLTKANVKSIINNLDPDGYSYLSNFGDVDYDGYNNVLNEAVQNAFESANNDVDLIGGLINADGNVERVYAALEKVKGQSGIIAKKDSGDTHYVVGNPNQIKSSELVTYDDNGSIIPLSQRFNSGSRDIRYSLNENPDSDFARAVDDVARGVEPTSSVVHLGTTPDVLKMLGIDNARVVMGIRTLRKDMLNKHSVSPEAMKQLPKQMNNPVAVMRSQSDSSNPNAYLMLTELVEVENGKSKPIIAALSFEKNSKGELELINIASAYGRRPNQINRDLANTLYWNKAKGEQLINNFSLLEAAETASLRTLLSSATRLFDSNIKTEADLSQYLNRKNLAESIDIDTFNQTLKRAVGESAVENIDVIQRGTMPDGMKKLITSDVEGWFDPRSNKITLVADGIHATPNMTKEQRIAWVAWHELAHRGVNVRLKGEYKSVMHRADSHPVINAVATAIQQQRQGTRDSAATHRHAAIEEALAEVFAAYQTGNFAELESRYGVNTAELQNPTFKSWLDRFADKVRALIDKLFGTETADKFSNADLVALMTEIKQGALSGDSVNARGNLNNDIRHSLNESPNSDFARAVDTIVGGGNVRGYVNVGTTPSVLKMLGLPDVKVTLHNSTFNKVMGGKHNISPDALKQLPRQINNPIAVMKSAPQASRNGYVILTELIEHNRELGIDEPVVAALHFKQDANGIELINIASVYGKNLRGMQNMLNHDLLYWNKTKGSQFIDTFGLQLPAYVSNDANLSNANIKTNEDLMQALPEIKFSRVAKEMQETYTKLGGAKQESVFTQMVNAAQEGKSRSVPEWKSWLLELGKKTNTAIFDALAPLKYFEDDAGVTDPSKSAYTAARLAAGSSSIVEASMMYGLLEFDKDGFVQRKQGTSEKDSLLGIMESLGNDGEDFLFWVAGNRADKLYAEGRENNLTPQEIARLKTLNKGRETKFENARKKLMAWNKAMLDFAQEAGLFTKEERVQWEDPDWYIPFYREKENGDAAMPYKNKGLASQNSGIRRLKGGENATSDLLGNIIANSSKLIDASVKNMAMTKAVVNLADSGVITTIEKPNLMDYQRLNKSTKDGGIATVKIKGQQYLIEVHDQALFNALTRIDYKPNHNFLRKMAIGAKRLLTSTVTAMPDFIVRNFLRDIVQSATTDRNSIKLGVDALKGLKEAYSKNGAAIDLMFSGASFGSGYIDAGDPKVAAEKIRRHLRKKGYTKAEADSYMSSIIWSKDQLGRILDKYKEINSAAENANRIAVYNAALQNNKSKIQAAFEAKDLMDFSMQGNAQVIRFLADVLPFFNARLQGLSQLGRALKDNPRKVAVRGMMIAAASSLLSALNAGNDAYEELPDEEKDNYWHLFVGDEHFRIPKPFEIGVIFGTVPERLFRTMNGLDSTGRFADRVFAAMSDTLSMNPVPQLVKPVLEVYNNKDSFTGREIESMTDRRLLPEARYDHNTSIIARSLGEVTGQFGVSPKQLEHLVRGYFGTMGMYVLGMSDRVIRAGGDYGDKPQQYWNEYPVLSALFRGDVNVPRKYTSYMNDYYNYLNKATEITATANSYEEEGKIQEQRQLLQDNARLLAYKPTLNKVQKEVRQIKASMDLIMNDRILSAEQKRERLDRLIAQRNALIKSIAERMREEDF